jgi:predicted MFS family arabinose efflux permease
VILSITGLFALVYGIIEAGIRGWTDERVLLAFGAALVLLGAFAIWEATYKHAMLPLYFFKNMSFTGANTAMALVIFSLMGAMFFMSQYFQSVQGLTALDTGIRILPMALTMMVSAVLSAQLARRLKIKLTVSLGFLLAAGATFFMSQTIDVDTSYSTILIGLVAMAAGMGMAMPPATDSIMGSVPVSKAGIGSAMNDTTRELGGALGVAILGTLMNNIYLSDIKAINALPVASTLPAEAMDAIHSSIQGALAVARNPQMPAEMGNAIADIASHAFVNGMTSAMFISAIVMVAASVVTLALLPAEIRRPQEEQPEAAFELSQPEFVGDVVPEYAGD